MFAPALMAFAERAEFGYVYQMSKVFQRMVLTRERVRLAFAVAVATDVLQLALGPFGWAFARRKK